MVEDLDRRTALHAGDVVLVLEQGAQGGIDAVRVERDNVEERGVTEAIVNMQTLEFGDIAHVLVLYTSDFPDDDRPPRPGVDSFNLIRKDGRWLIASVLNEIPTAERPIPDVLMKENR